MLPAHQVHELGRGQEQLQDAAEGEAGGFWGALGLPLTMLFGEVSLPGRASVSPLVRGGLDQTNSKDL